MNTNEVFRISTVLLAVILVAVLLMPYLTADDKPIKIINPKVEGIESFELIDESTSSFVRGSLLISNSLAEYDFQIILYFFIAESDFGGLSIDSEQAVPKIIFSSYQDDPFALNTHVQRLDDHTTVFVGRSLYTDDAIGGGGYGHMVLGFKIKENSVYGIDDPVKIKVGIGSLIKDGVKYMGLTNIVLEVKSDAL